MGSVLVEEWLLGKRAQYRDLRGYVWPLPYDYPYRVDANASTVIPGLCFLFVPDGSIQGLILKPEPCEIPDLEFLEYELHYPGICPGCHSEYNVVGHTRFFCGLCSYDYYVVESGGEHYILEEPLDPAYFCPRCGCHWKVHNDDGSCVIEEPRA